MSLINHVELMCDGCGHEEWFLPRASGSRLPETWVTLHICPKCRPAIERAIMKLPVCAHDATPPSTTTADG